MNRILLFVFISLLFIVSGCREETLDIPENAKNAIMVSHLKDAELTFIDEESRQVVDSVKLDAAITDMVRIDDSRIAYTSKESGLLSVLNTENGQVKQWEGVGRGVSELLFSHETNLLFLADSGNNQLKVFDIEKEKVKAEIPVGTFPLSMTVNPDENLLFVVNQKDSSVSAIDMKKLKVVRELLVPYLPEGILYKDSKLYIGGHGPVHGDLNRFVHVIDPESGRQLGRIEVGLMPVKFFSPRSSSDLYVVCHGSHELYKISGDENTDKIKVGANPYDIAGNEKEMYVSSMDSQSLSILDVESFKIISEIDISGAPVAIIEGGGSE
ncbi:YncE family protein [Bacillus salacetis]|uniref:YncE family protein n=1 Tax=Bacillus salacetis TaxID=2315464 RepID=A0A3A1QQH6_9BACI|nr:YncE family protein [Bacillus salacetis]RIW29365.1 YncE family protein [Bacillus salacetis]